MRFVFFVEGLNIEMDAFGLSEKAARDRLWRDLTDEQRNRVVQIECVDQMEVMDDGNWTVSGCTCCSDGIWMRGADACEG